MSGPFRVHRDPHFRYPSVRAYATYERAMEIAHAVALQDRRPVVVGDDATGERLVCLLAVGPDRVHVVAR